MSPSRKSFFAVACTAFAIPLPHACFRRWCWGVGADKVGVRTSICIHSRHTESVDVQAARTHPSMPAQESIPTSLRREYRMRDRLTLRRAKEWAPGECELIGAQKWLEKNLTEVYRLFPNDRVGAELRSLRHALPSLTNLTMPRATSPSRQIHHLHLSIRVYIWMSSTVW